MAIPAGFFKVQFFCGGVVVKEKKLLGWVAEMEVDYFEGRRLIDILYERRILEEQYGRSISVRITPVSAEPVLSEATKFL